MSDNNPYEQLGVTENASFEEIQAAKKRLFEKHGNDSTVLEKVETAYDSIIMDRLRLRQEGKIKVPEKIRFPERTVEKPLPTTPMITNNSTEWLQQLIDTPSQMDILLPTGIFLVLAGIAVFSQNTGNSSLPLLMALGFMANIYFLNRKENRFGRALLISAIALLSGVALGSGIESLLASNSGGTLLGGEQFEAAVTFCLFWLTSCFIR